MGKKGKNIQAVTSAFTSFYVKYIINFICKMDNLEKRRQAMKFVKNKKYILIMLILLSSFSLIGRNSRDGVGNESQSPYGFLSNMKELREISVIMDIIGKNHLNEVEIDRERLRQGSIKGMIESLNDPYSGYFTPEEFKSFQDGMKGEYAGVGMIIQKARDEYLLVVSPIEDSPAYKAGIKPKDRIVSIDGESTFNLTTEESVERLKGAADTVVKVNVYRESTEETREIELIRAEIALKYVKHEMLNEDKIGYLRLTQFGENVYTDASKAIEDLKKQGMEALIVDVRSNPGGALDQAIKISSMFIENGIIVSTKTKTGKQEIFNRQGQYFGDFPLAILIDEGSASASEILSGAIKDHERGILVGQKSFGKGSVQTVVQLPSGDGIKLTIAEYYTPKGISINGKGIEPDILVEEDEKYMLFGGMGNIVNIDEETARENRATLLKEARGEEVAENFENYEDVQLNTAIRELKDILEKKVSS